MEKKFELSVSDDKRKISIFLTFDPATFEEYTEIFKELMYAWGFHHETVDSYFSFDDLVKEYEETIYNLKEEHRKEIESLKKVHKKEIESLKRRKME